jgi:3'-phosphoadenosine 5'-phosphosulfate sulfotransferase (PAPS reductase)/FAD synthetase
MNTNNPFDDLDPEPGNHVALISGGVDSAVAAHLSITEGPCDILVYLDTGTGLDSNRKYVEKFSDHLEVQLWTLRTNVNYEDMVMENGFVGPAQHSLAYRNLKERQLNRLATMTAGRGNSSDLHCWTGVRRDESQRRMKTVGSEVDGLRFSFHSPIADWTKDDCLEYLDEHDLPKSDLWDTLHRSSDCFCSAFAGPSEVLDLRAAGEDAHADWIRELEQRVDLDEKQERERWGWGGLNPEEQKQARAEQDDDQMLLCASCGMTSSDPDIVCETDESD